MQEFVWYQANDVQPTPMRHWLRVVEDVREGRDFLAVGLLTLVAFSSAVVLFVGLTAPGARLGFARFHLRGSFVEWAAFQPVPAMYNFRNRIWKYPARRAAGTPLHPPWEMRRRGAFQYINHHPYSTMVFLKYAALPQRGCITTIILSDYREQVMRTDFATCRVSEGVFSIAALGE